MRICNNAAASAALVAASASLTVEAFAPSPNFNHRRATATLRVLPDPVVVTSAVESSTVVTGAVMETLGSLALLGSVGFGVAVSKQNNKDWSYEYKPGSGYVEGGSDLALLEEDPVSVVAKVEEEEAAAAPEPVAAAKEPEPEPEPSVPEVVPEPAKASTPSKELLESAAAAKAAVVKKGVAETKEKMTSKGAAKATPPAEEKEEAAPTTEVAETKKPGAKRRFAKGMTLILAAGGLALARNVVKAYLGRGML